MSKLTTRHLQATRANHIAETAAYLQQGHLVVYPTDTLYGIGANAFNAVAVRALYQAKQRPFSKGLPILTADPDDLTNVIRHIPTGVQTYIEQFWPGPLTLLFPKHQTLPTIISPNDNVAVRIPNCETARAVIRAAGGAIATSSANLAGGTPAQTAAHALATFDGIVAAVLDNGPSPQAIASTILDCTTPSPTLLRLGPISPEALSLKPGFNAL